MTYERLIEALRITFPSTEVLMKARIPVTRIISMAIVEFWVNQTEENEYTKVIRIVAKELNEGGFLPE